MSVSRVGGAAQTRAMRQVAGKLRLELAQFRELEAFAQFGASDLDKSARDQLERGKRIVEVLKQPQFSPMRLAHQVIILYAVTNGYLDDVPVDTVRTWERRLHGFIDASHVELVRMIDSDGEIKPETERLLQDVLQQFKGSIR